MEGQELAANVGEVAASQASEQTQDAETSQQQTDTSQVDVTQTQAFAHRLKEEKAKERDAVISEMYGEKYGIHTYAEYQEAIRKQQEAEERQRLEDAGIDPELIKSAIDKHPDIQFAREIRSKQEADAKFQAEAKELFAEFPDLKPDQIPAETWVLKEQKGLSLLDAYLRASYKTLGQQKEQEAIQKLQTNAQTSTGSLGGGDVNHVTKVSQLSKDEFKKLEEAVLRGEVKQL